MKQYLHYLRKGVIFMSTAILGALLILYPFYLRFIKSSLPSKLPENLISNNNLLLLP